MMQIHFPEELHPEIEKFIDPSRVMADVSYNAHDFDNAFVDHMGLVVWYGEMAARAERQAMLAKHTVETTEARVTKELRAMYQARGVKPTETRITGEVDLNPDLIDAKWKLRDAKYVASVLATVVTAMEHRRSMMLQHARTDVRNAQGNPMLRES